MNKKSFKKLSLVFIFIFLSLNFAFGQSDTYQNVSTGLNNESETVISNTSTGGLADTARYIALMASAAIIALVIFKLIEGAVLKGTYDNIYDQQKGNKILKNAVASFLIFIFVNLLFSYINPDYGSWIFNTSTGVTNTSSEDISSQCINDPKYISASFLDQLKQDEESNKFAEKPYMDSLGYPTIGWGFNLDSSNDPKKYLTQVGIKDTQLTNLTSCKKGVEGSKTLIGNCGNEKITKEQADKLLEIEMEAHLPAAKAFAGGEEAFNKLPVNIQNVIKNISYAGDGTLAKFINLKAAVRSSPLNYDNIAAEVIDSDWCKQTKSRCGRVVGLIYNGKCPTINSTNNTSIAGQKDKNAAETCKKILNIKTSDLVDLNTLGVPCESTESTCFVTKEFGNVVKKVAAEYNKKFPKRTFRVVSAYRSDEQQTKMCTTGSGKDSACAPSCKTSNNTSYSNHQLGNAIDVSNDTIGGCTKKGVCNSDEFKYLKSVSSDFKNELRNDNIHFSTSGR